jgi:hypothetical protein
MHEWMDNISMDLNEGSWDNAVWIVIGNRLDD